jgi:hypothetical protein
MENTPANISPLESIEISPEALEVANCYLQCQDIRVVAEELGLRIETVKSYLDRREVKSYVDHVFFDSGFNNRYKMRRAMDAVLAKKFQEMEEAGTGSSKDIADLLALSHKMSMDILDKQIALEKLKQSDIKNQVNVQINDSGVSLNDGSKYGALISKLLDLGNAEDKS